MNFPLHFFVTAKWLIIGFLSKDIGANIAKSSLQITNQSHKDEVERFLRGVYQKGRQDQEDAESVRRELARIEQAALNSVGIQGKYKSSSGSSSYADKPIRKATEYYVSPNVPTIEELRQQSEAEKVKLQGREEWALNKEIAKVGEWETVVSTPPAADPTQDATTKNEKNAESTSTHDQGAEFQDDDEDQEDLHHFKIKEKEYPADLDIAPEQDQDSEPLTFKKRKKDGNDTTFKSRKKKPLRKKD
ncbi:unnamed protein product [Mucor circinelloides]